MAPFKVIIIGSGLAGSLLGNGLMHNDVDFMIYESDERNSSREGYQIRLGSPALIGFRACLTSEQQNALYKMFGRSGGMISSAPKLYDTHLKLLLDLTKFPAYTKSAPINRVILRNFLQQPLDEARRVCFGKRFEKYELMYGDDGHSTGVKAIFDDGSEDSCDLLISAEGSVSKVNKQIGLNNIVQLTEKWGFLAKGNLPIHKLASLTPEVRSSPMAVINGGVVLFYSAYLPQNLRQGGKQARDAKQEPDVPDYDQDAASLFWGLQVPRELCPEDPRKLEDKLGFCVQLIKDWDPRFHDMIRAAENDDIYVFQARASDPPPKAWRDKTKSEEARDTSQNNSRGLGADRVWLIGDAIHPMLPARGMGGNQAMNDTVDALTSILELNTASKTRALTENDFASAVKQYEDKMLPRAFKWVAASGGTGTKLLEPNSYIGRIALFAMARVLDMAYIFSLIKNLLGYKVEDDAPELPT